LVSRLNLGDHVWRFELVQNGQGDAAEHAHFLCTNCGEVSCLEGVEIRVSGVWDLSRIEAASQKCHKFLWRIKKRREGIRTPGPSFPGHGISSAAKVSCTTLKRCDETPFINGFFAPLDFSEFCQNRICQRSVKTGWASQPCAALLSKPPPIGPRYPVHWTQPPPSLSLLKLGPLAQFLGKTG